MITLDTAYKNKRKKFILTAVKQKLSHLSQSFNKSKSVGLKHKSCETLVYLLAGLQYLGERGSLR